MRAADDFAAIRARLEELERERRPEPPPKIKDYQDLIRRVRSVPIGEARPHLVREPPRKTHQAAWRLLEMIGDDRGPMLSRAAAELRACLVCEQVMKENNPAG